MPVVYAEHAWIPKEELRGWGVGGGVGNISFLGGGRTNLFCILQCKFGNLGGGGVRVWTAL